MSVYLIVVSSYKAIDLYIDFFSRCHNYISILFTADLNKRTVPMDIKFNSYEYHMIRKFTSMCYGSRCNVIDRIKIRNKISVWHEILTYLLSPDGVLKIYKVECSPGENNNLVTSDSQPNYVVRPLFYLILT